MSVFSIQRQLRLRVDNMEEFAYKKYDFRYRRAGTMARSGSQRQVPQAEDQQYAQLLNEDQAEHIDKSDENRRNSKDFEA